MSCIHHHLLHDYTMATCTLERTWATTQPPTTIHRFVISFFPFNSIDFDVCDAASREEHSCHDRFISIHKWSAETASDRWASTGDRSQQKYVHRLSIIVRFFVQTCPHPPSSPSKRQQNVSRVVSSGIYSIESNEWRPQLVFIFCSFVVVVVVASFVSLLLFNDLRCVQLIAVTSTSSRRMQHTHTLTHTYRWLEL